MWIGFLYNFHWVDMICLVLMMQLLLSMSHFISTWKITLMFWWISVIIKSSDDVTIVAEAFKNHLNVTSFQGWQDKPLHGQNLCIYMMIIVPNPLWFNNWDWKFNLGCPSHLSLVDLTLCVVFVALTIKLLFTLFLAVQLWRAHYA